MASEELLFDPSLKKRKKKTVAFTEDPLGPDADPTTPAPTTIDNHVADGIVDLGPTTLHEQIKRNESEAAEIENTMEVADIIKKKKKKKDIPLDFGEDGMTVTVPNEDLDFSDMKKKKKAGKKKVIEDLERELNEAKAKGDADAEANDGEHLNDFDEAELGDDPFARAEVPTGMDSGTEPWLGSDRDYSYDELLQRFYASLHASNPSLLTSAGKRYTIPPPQVFREGIRRSIFANLADICKRMHRPPDHVTQFLFTEMGTTGSVDGASRLVIKGRFQPKQVENVLRRYIVEYVTCKTCKSPDTILMKENRIFFVVCESCGSRRSVNAIKSGYQAQVGKRSKNKVA